MLLNLKLILVLSVIWIFNFRFINPDNFNDLNTYIEYLDSHQPILGENLNITLILRSGIFFTLLEIVNYILENVVMTLLVFKTIPLLIIYYSLRKYAIPLHVIILFLAPVYIDLINSQLRNSLAAALIIFAYTTKNPTGRFVGFIFGCIIHLSSYMLVAVYYLSKIVIKIFRKKTIFLLLTIYFITVVLISAPLMIFEILDDERYHIYFRENVIINKGYLIFAILLIATTYVNYKKDNELDTIVLFIGFMVFELIMTGGYYTRYIALFWPLVILNLRDLKPTSPKYLLILFYTAYSFFTNYIL